MKTTFRILIILCFTSGLMLSSCGPGKKLLVSQARIQKLQKDSANTHDQLNASIQLVQSLTNEKTTLQNENAKSQADLKSLSSESKMTIADQAMRLKTLQGLIQSQKDVMNNLKNTIADALLNYTSDELTVTIKDGKVYVSLEEKLLFKSGSDVVDPKGKEALKSLATVLKGTKDIMVMIEGHTDNVPIKTSQFKDNWDLSTARATSIVRILTIDNGFDSGRITASGRSTFHPVTTNETAEGRAGNRRTEIILSPDLKELFKILEQ